MSDRQRPTFRASSTEDIIALVPFLLGFHPSTSLVFLTVDESKRGLVTAVARLDLPDPQTPTEVAAATAQAVTALDASTGSSVILLGYGPADRVVPMLTAAAEAFDAIGVAIHAMVRIDEGRYWHLRGVDRAEVPPGGVLFDPSSSPATAQAVFAGLVALPDRHALADTLAPVTGLARDRMIAATTAACTLVADILDTARPAGAGSRPTDEAPDAVLDTPTGQALQAAARTFLADIQDRYRAGHPVSDPAAAMLTVLLELTSLRGFTARATRGQAWQIDMWSDLVRRAEPAFTAPAATLLALSALQAGHGALANLAVERALDADPQDRLAQTLALAIAAGITPSTVTALLTD